MDRWQQQQQEQDRRRRQQELQRQQQEEQKRRKDRQRMQDEQQRRHQQELQRQRQDEQKRRKERQRTQDEEQRRRRPEKLHPRGGENQVASRKSPDSRVRSPNYLDLLGAVASIEGQLAKAYNASGRMKEVGHLSRALTDTTVAFLGKIRPPKSCIKLHEYLLEWQRQGVRALSAELRGKVDEQSAVSASYLAAGRRFATALDEYISTRLRSRTESASPNVSRPRTKRTKLYIMAWIIVSVVIVWAGFGILLEHRLPFGVRLIALVVFAVAVLAIRFRQKH